MKGTRIIKLVIFIAITGGFTFLFNSKIGDIPPLGKFLNPFTGFWQNAEDVEDVSNLSLIQAGLQDSVRILIDEQGIPHVFAENEHDLYFTQGYITAKNRLWQMDFQTRYAAGRLSEVVGSKAIELDRYQRRMGMVYGAQAMLKESLNDPKSKLIIEAYSEGVNAYIKALSPRDYPIEFKILDYKPEEWTPLNSALLLKLMSATLARGTNELAMNNILAKYGEGVTNDLFPNYPFLEDPIIPAGTSWNFDVNGPKPPISPSPLVSIVQTNTGIEANKENNAEFLSSRLLTATKEENVGSNNWAIAGNRSSTGFPILANDPHLDLTLPSIWYQIQLHSPTVNVYGVSIPGAPNVIIGFNENIAWGVTNVGSDVLDWYKIQFKDDTHQEYLYNNQWRKTDRRIEEIKIRGEKAVLDTVYYTHQGPVSYAKGQKPANFSMANNIPIDYALKWVAHLPSNELRTFYELNKATDYNDYRKALVYFSAPAQNFVFADRQGDISITSNGLFPFKEKRQGKFLLDGNDSTDQWTDRIPSEENPTVKNPARGYVSSANQWPVDPSYPYYLGWEFGSYERAHRINNQLETMHAANLESFKALQNDNYSILAENILDTLVHILQKGQGLNSTEVEALGLLAKWDRRYEVNSIAASLFETWYNTLNRMIWSDDFGSSDLLMRYPSRDRTVHLLLHEPLSPWFSNGSTNLTRDEVVLASFKGSVQQLEKDYGKLSNWEWGMVKKSHVPHLADIGGFGSKILKVGGSKHTVNAMGESNGPSWKMVVLLGEKPKAYGVIPGGQSGNPGSKFYDNQIATWEKGELKELLFLENSNSKQKGIISQIDLKK